MARRVLSAVRLVGLVLAVVPSLAGAAPRTVSPSQIRVTGAMYFSEEQIAEKLSLSLLNESEVTSKSEPEEVQAYFEKTVLANYRSAGYLDASVKTQAIPFSDEYEIEIDEGRHYLAGNLGVKGLPEPDIETFLAALTSPQIRGDFEVRRFRREGGEWIPEYYSKSGKLIRPAPSRWTPGRPVCTNASEEPSISSEIRWACTAIGLVTGHVEVGDLLRDADTVHCELTFTELGRRLTGSSFQVLGCERNSPEDLLEYLEIKPEEVLDRKRLEDIRLRLWLSGRFSSIRGRVVLPNEAGEPATVTCEVDEYEHAPPLVEPLPEAEQVMLRFHQWLTEFPERTDTWQVDIPSLPGEPKCHLAPRQGFSVQTQDHRLLVHSDRAVYCPSDRREKLSIPLGNRAFTMDVTVAFSSDDPDNIRPEFRYNLWMESLSPDSSQGSVLVRVHADPCACLAMLHAADARYRIDNGVLFIESPRNRIEIDANTGQLLKLAELLEDGSERFQLSHTAEDLETVRGSLEQEWREYPDVFIPSAPISSSVRFVAADPIIGAAVWSGVQERLKLRLDERQKAVLVRLLDASLLPTADEMFCRWERQQRDDRPVFHAQRERELYSGIPQNAAATAVATNVALRLFTPGTWPHHYIGAVGFAYGQCRDLSKYHGAVLFGSKIHSPVRDLAIAEFMKTGQAETANQFAWRGLGQMNYESFLSDRAALLDEGHVFGRFAVRVAEELQDLTDQEAEALMDALFGGPESGFAAALQYLRQNRDRPAWEVLPDAVEAAWEAGWYEVVNSRLLTIIQTTPTPAKKPTPIWETVEKEGAEQNAENEEPSAQNAKTETKPVWELVPEVQVDKDLPAPGEPFELRGPFSK